MSDRTMNGTNATGTAWGDPMLRRAIWSCSIGQVFENFDFVLYGFMAVALSRAFFPSEDPVAALLSTFATFAVGFLMRPVGAFVVGRYGDKYGRRRALVLTIVMMALATGIVGLIPTYETIGIAAPIALVLCRLFQGFAAGGEWGGAAVFLVEYAPTEQRGFISSFQQIGTGLGLLLATFSAALLSFFLDAQSFQAWGWRIPFLVGFILGPIGHYLRTRVAETPAFTRQIAKQTVARAPIREAFATQWGNMVTIFGVSIIPVCLYWVFLVFLPTFAVRQLHMNASATFFSTTLAGVIYVVVTPIWVPSPIGWAQAAFLCLRRRLHRAFLPAVPSARVMEHDLGPGADASGRNLDTNILHGRGLRGAVGSIPDEGTILRAVDQLWLGGCDLWRLRPVYRDGADQCDRRSYRSRLLRHGGGLADPNRPLLRAGRSGKAPSRLIRLGPDARREKLGRT